jgi:hypothetical protein
VGMGELGMRIFTIIIYLDFNFFLFPFSHIPKYVVVILFYFYCWEEFILFILVILGDVGIGNEIFYYYK